MKPLRYVPIFLLLALIPTGCTPGVTYVVDVAYTPKLKEHVVAKPEQIQVAVIPFEDMRTDKRIIGRRRRIFGRVDEFQIRPSPASKAVTEALVSALKIHGYRVSVLPEGTDEKSITQSPPHVVISGNIEDLRADAQAKLGYTDITTIVSLKVNVYKIDEKNSYTVNIQSQSDPRVIFFNPGVMQNAINDVLTDVINKLLTNLK